MYLNFFLGRFAFFVLAFEFLLGAITGKIFYCLYYFISAAKIHFIFLTAKYFFKKISYRFLTINC